MSSHSLLSANDKDDNKIIPEAVYRSSGIYFTAEESPGKPQLVDRLLKPVRPVNATNGVPYLRIASLGSHSTQVGRRKEGRGYLEGD